MKCVVGELEFILERLEPRQFGKYKEVLCELKLSCLLENGEKFDR